MAKSIEAGIARFDFQHRLLTLSPPGERRLAGMVYACDNPDCPGLHMGLEGEERASFSLDTLARTVSCDGSDQGGQKERLERFLTEVEWNLLGEILNLSHQPLKTPFSESDIRSIVTKKDMRRGEMIGFIEVFPLASAIYPHRKKHQTRTEEQESDVVLVDGYCVVPDCKCHDCIAEVTEVTKQGTISKIRRAEFLIDLNNGTVKQTIKVDAGFSADAAFKTVSELCPGFLEKLRERRKLLREAVASAWGLEEMKHNKRMLPSEGASSTLRKVGRNERCVCGSGKKFKHCCGA